MVDHTESTIGQTPLNGYIWVLGQKTCCIGMLAGIVLANRQISMEGERSKI
jgi:hypothetical protein